VLLGDFLLLFSLKKLSESLQLDKKYSCIMLILIQGFGGLVIVDNMHFQYNTLLYAIFFYSISFAFEEKFLKSAIVYVFLLNMKHIFLYVVCTLLLTNNYNLGACILHFLFEILCIKRKEIQHFKFFEVNYCNYNSSFSFIFPIY
jgi:hypothetical protein